MLKVGVKKGEDYKKWFQGNSNEGKWMNERNEVTREGE